MGKLLIFATSTISLALVFYTIGVWSERKAKNLKKSHVVSFWLGLVFDILGTLTMERIAGSGVTNISTISSAMHGITGVLAILLMAFHVLWATIVLIKNDETKKKVFHKFSLFVWMIWLVPYLIGMVNGIMQ
jgi:uncharacterized repeat protein (TIGR03987 family)